MLDQMRFDQVNFSYLITPNKLFSFAYFCNKYQERREARRRKLENLIILEKFEERKEKKIDD